MFLILGVGDRGVAHSRRGIAEEKEEHAAPCYDVEAVQSDEEAEGGAEPFPEGFEGDRGGGCPGRFRGFVVAGEEGRLLGCVGRVGGAVVG